MQKLTTPITSEVPSPLHDRAVQSCAQNRWQRDGKQLLHPTTKLCAQMVTPTSCCCRNLIRCFLRLEKHPTDQNYCLFSPNKASFHWIFHTTSADLVTLAVLNGLFEQTRILSYLLYWIFQHLVHFVITRAYWHLYLLTLSPLPEKPFNKYQFYFTVHDLQCHKLQCSKMSVWCSNTCFPAFGILGIIEQLLLPQLAFPCSWSCNLPMQGFDTCPFKAACNAHKTTLYCSSREWTIYIVPFTLWGRSGHRGYVH